MYNSCKLIYYAHSRENAPVLHPRDTPPKLASSLKIAKKLTKLYYFRKKYEQELAEMYLIIESMDDDLRQMIMAKKD